VALARRVAYETKAQPQGPRPPGQSHQIIRQEKYNSMLRAGFHTVKVDDLSTFKPMKGDVAVIKATTHHKSGHIQGYDGKNWISDFVQKNGFWPGKEYREEIPDYVIYRP
jgi:hypothetical protein